eukprot:SAG31_NODE_1396_length_8511_cov_1.939491_2_plen_137_part_00
MTRSGCAHNGSDELISVKAQQCRAQATNQQLSLLPQHTSPSALHSSISLIIKAFALVAVGSCARVCLAVGSCARSLPAAEWTGATLRSGFGWVRRPFKALGFWSSDVFCFAGSWGGGVRGTMMATRGRGSAHTTII